MRNLSQTILKKKQIIFAFLLTGLVTFSCEKEEVVKSVTIDELRNKYSLSIAADQKGFATVPELTFATAADADKFMFNVKNRAPLHFESGAKAEGSDKSGRKTSTGVDLAFENTKISLEGLKRMSQMTTSEGGGYQSTPGTVTVVWHSATPTYHVTMDWSTNYASPNVNVHIVSYLNASTFTQSTTPSNGVYYTSSTGILTFNVNGFQNYNVFVEGVGTIYSQPVKVSGTYNTRTGVSNMTVTNR